MRRGTALCSGIEQVPDNQTPARSPCIVLVSLVLLAGCGKNEGEISGAAWLENTSGQSDVLRGLTICILRPALKADVEPYYSEELENHQEVLAACRRDLAEPPLDDPIKEIVRKLNIESIPRREREIADIKRRILRLPENADVTLTTFADVFASHIDGPLSADVLSMSVGHWMPILKRLLVKGAETGIEGKYLISDVPPGKYYIYAQHRAANGAWVVWCLPITAKQGEVSQINLFNGNTTLAAR